MVLSGCSGKKAQDEQLAIKELRKLESNTRTGLSLVQYSDRLLTTTAEVDVALKDDPDQAFVKRVHRIERIYRDARDSWDQDIHGDSDDRSELQTMWADASARLDRLDLYVQSSSAQRENMDAEDRHADEIKVAEARRDARAFGHEQAQEAERDLKKSAASRAEEARREADERAQDAQREEAEKAREHKEQLDKIAAANAEHERRFAPEGTLFLLQNVTARIKGGLAGITPGTEVTRPPKEPGRHAPRQSESKHAGSQHQTRIGDQ